MSAVLLNNLAEVLDKFGDALQGLKKYLRRQFGRAEQGAEAAGPLGELVTVLRRHAQDLRDHDGGQRIGEFGNNVHRPFARAASSSSLTICSMRSRIASTTRGVKAFAARLRRRV